VLDGFLHAGPLPPPVVPLLLLLQPTTNSAATTEATKEAETIERSMGVPPESVARIGRAPLSSL
jgi:hypothetical protein